MSRLKSLPLPKLKVGLPVGHERDALLSLSKNESAAVEGLPVLQKGHIAALFGISEQWYLATGISKGLLLKRWAHAIFPTSNQLSGPAHSVYDKFRRVGGNFYDQDGNFRNTHPQLKAEYSKWKTAAAKKARKMMKRAGGG